MVQLVHCFTWAVKQGQNVKHEVNLIIMTAPAVMLFLIQAYSNLARIFCNVFYGNG